MKTLARQLCPPLLLPALRRLTGRGMRFHAASDWASAAEASKGYSDVAIVERVRHATRRVVEGKAAYERDSVLFHELHVPFHLVAGLLRSATQDGGRLNVIDIGGSLGSTYRQCRPFLAVLARIDWHIVEQPHFVAAGRAEFTSGELSFHEDVDSVPMSATPATFLLSSSLQYFQHPDGLLDALARRPARHLLVDRTPFTEGLNDRPCVQFASRTVYDGSYPCWIISRPRLLARLASHWRVVSEYCSPEGRNVMSDGTEFEFRGLLLERLP